MLYNPFSYEIHVDPYPTYRELREHAPVYHNPEIGFWALTRFEDVWNATLDWQTFSSSAGPSIEMQGVPIPMMIAMDPPAHSVNRGLVSKAFTPRRIAELEPRIREIVTGHLERLVGRERFDAVADFSAYFPMDVISTLLGIPQEDRDQVREWSNAQLHRIPGQVMPPPEALRAGLNSRAYFERLTGERRRKPQDDLLSALIAAELEDEERRVRRLSQEELLGFCALLSSAGNETLTKFFGNAIYHLARHPEQRTELARDPGLIPDAVEEILRLDPPSQYQGRITMRDVELRGRTIPARSRVILVTGAACRDEREFQNPDALDIHRKIERQLALGYGRHLCLGASLARLEARIALQEWHRRFPVYRVHEDELGYVHSSNVRGFTSVPVSVA
jgi:cytochrome P450